MEVRQFSLPTSSDQFEYLLRLYFGPDLDRLSCCVDRAYRDLNRTLHGFARLSQGEELRGRASAVVRGFLTSLAELRADDLDQTVFDDRHRTACAELCSTYSAAGFTKFRVGQAQKWLNMALKYVFAFGEDRVPGYADLFELAHIPLDNIILEQLRSYGAPELTTRWSRVSSYEEYMVIQRWVRSFFVGSAPLAVEFALWQSTGGADTADKNSAEPQEGTRNGSRT